MTCSRPPASRWNPNCVRRWSRGSDMILGRYACIVMGQRLRQLKRFEPGPTRSAMRSCWDLPRPISGVGTTFRCSSHELAHVVQQDKAFGGSGQSSLLQRSGLEVPNVTQGQASSASNGPEPQAAGLPEPDCDTRVADLFLLGAITCPQQPECCFAQIHDRKNRNLTGIFRADHQLEGKPDCEFGDQKHHDFWLANHWRILEITTSGLTVMNMCGREETLDVEGIGSLKGEPASAVVPGRTPSSTSLPPNIVDHTQGMWGNTHKIHYDDQCNSLHFVPNAPGKESKVYRWDSALESFVNESDPTDTKTPGQLERFAGIVLKEHKDGEWQGTNCGDLPRWAL
jgi:hypothetical protein